MIPSIQRRADWGSLEPQPPTLQLWPARDLGIQIVGWLRNSGLFITSRWDNFHGTYLLMIHRFLIQMLLITAHQFPLITGWHRRCHCCDFIFTIITKYLSLPPRQPRPPGASTIRGPELTKLWPGGANRQQLTYYKTLVNSNPSVLEYSQNNVYRFPIAIVSGSR